MQRSWAHFLCICFRVCDWQKPEYPRPTGAPWLTKLLHRMVSRSSGRLGSPFYICGTGVKIMRALGPQTCLRACKLFKLFIWWACSNSVISHFSEKQKSGPLKDCEGPQKYDIKGPNDPWHLFLILTPAVVSMHLIFHVLASLLISDADDEASSYRQSSDGDHGSSCPMC